MYILNALKSDVSSVLKIDTDKVKSFIGAKYIGAGIMTYIVNAILALLGGWDNYMGALSLFIAIDVIFGLSASIYRGEFKSKLLRIGIIRKIGTFAIIMVAHSIDSVLITEMGINGDFGIRTVAIFSFATYEVTSLIENWIAIGGPFPEPLKSKFAKVKSIVESNLDETTDIENDN